MKKVNINLAVHLSILIAIFLYVVFKNLPFGLWFSGWDNLHPEFNSWLNIKRVFNSSVWEYFQGLGTNGGHGYPAVLLHSIFTYLMSIFLPHIYIRSVFTFTMLIVGSLGLFFIVKKNLKDKQEDTKNKSALIASLFYMLNLATIQQFYVQLEAFIIHFAIIPWLFYSLLSFLTNRAKRSLIIFAIISFLSTPQAFIPPLFIVYFIILSILLLVYFFQKRTLVRLKTSLLVILVTITVNSFWLLPNLYFALKESKTMIDSYNTIQSTDIFILTSQKYGTLLDAALLKGFLFQQKDIAKDQSGKTFLIFNNWIMHFNKTLTLVIGYGLFIIVIVGVLTLFKKRNYVEVGFLISGVVMFSMLANSMPPFSFIFNFLEHFSVIYQAFRVPFTKFSIGVAFFYSVFIGIGTAFIIDNFRRIIHDKKISMTTINLLTFTFIASIIYMALPAFKGDFIYSKTKVKIPSIYFQLFDFFKLQNKDERITNLPQGWPWGWSIYRWGYGGSGFLWYGIEQPLMDRAFDRWGKYNENYYWELSYAIYSNKFFLLPNILNKYNIKWIIFDKNSIPYLSSKDFIYQNNLEQYLDESEDVELVKTFKEKKLTNSIKVYRFNTKVESIENKSLIDFPKNILPIYIFTNYDQAYQEYSTYYSSDKFPAYSFYPFRSLFTGRGAQTTGFSIKVSSKDITFVSNIPDEFKNSPLVLSPPSEFENNNNKVEIEYNILNIKIPVDENTIIYNSTDDPYFFNHRPSNCVNNDCPEGLKQEIKKDGVLRFTSVDTSNLLTLGLPTVEQRFAYLIKITTRNIEGNKLEFALVNYDLGRVMNSIYLSKKDDFENHYFIVPPMRFDGIGYGMIFNNLSIGNQKTVNDLKQIVIYKIPYQFLTKTKLISNQKNVTDNTKESLFIYYQSFNKGWKAYKVESVNWAAKIFPFFFGEELKEHVLVNNWANGWVLQNQKSKIKNQRYHGENSKIVIVFLPQYLQYLGFGLLIGTFVFLLLPRPTPKESKSLLRHLRGDKI